MSSKSAPGSPVAAARAPKTSPITTKSISARLHGVSLSEGGLEASSRPFWRNGKWFMGSMATKDDDIVLIVANPKNKAVRGALEKLQKGIPGNRETTEYMMEGINKWISESRGSATTAKQEEEFVKYVWHHMRQKQRDNAAAAEAENLRMGLEDAKYQLTVHYAEFPDESKSDEELVAMFRRLGQWYSVISSEQRRIASKKRHEKEEKLIHEKFCGDRGAYNRWKALNEKVSHGYIRDVSPQLLVKFAKWFEENPDYLYPGSKDISISSAEHSVQDPLTYQYDTHRGYHNISLINADVSKEHMLPAIKELMDTFTSARIEVTLEFERSPNEFTMTDKYPLLNMHGCQRLISGEKQVIVAVNDGKLVVEKTTTMIKRLPDEFHKQLKGHCEREGLFKEMTCHRVFAHTPGLITAATISGQTHTSDRENFKINFRLTKRANKTFSFEEMQHQKRLEFVDKIKKEAADKRGRRVAETRPIVFATKRQQETARRMSSIRGPVPPSPSSSPHKNMARELIELGKMYKDGLLTEEEFNKAKADLL